MERMRCLVATSLALVVGAPATAGAGRQSDFSLRRAFKRSAPHEQLQVLRRFADPWQALAAALSRPSFREALGRQGSPLELGQRTRLVEDCSGQVHLERVYRDRHLLLHPGGEVSVKDRHYSVIRASWEPPRTRSRQYDRPGRDCWTSLGTAFRNPYLYPLIAGRLRRLDVDFTAANIAKLVETLERGRAP